MFFPFIGLFFEMFEFQINSRTKASYSMKRVKNDERFLVALWLLKLVVEQPKKSKNGCQRARFCFCCFCVLFFLFLDWIGIFWAFLLIFLLIWDFKNLVVNSWKFKLWFLCYIYYSLCTMYILGFLIEINWSDIFANKSLLVWFF